MRPAIVPRALCNCALSRLLPTARPPAPRQGSSASRLRTRSRSAATATACLAASAMLGARCSGCGRTQPPSASTRAASL
eukprot:6973315-Prymnesium_polylepis.2